MSVAPGTHLGPYEIVALLGAGGMGQVWKANDSRLGRVVAIKICAEQFSDRFEREARAIAALNHPNICTLYDVGPNYLVMEFLDGETLATRLKRGKIALEQTLEYGRQIANALTAAHAKSIVHRDLKPGNIMLVKSGVKVLDFGLARTEQDETITASRAVLGTPAYMAPEQREGRETSVCTDIYSLGLVLREMATGRREQMPDNQPAQFVHIIERCLATEPDDRWQSARDVSAELKWAAINPLTPPAPTSTSRRAVLGAIGGGVVGAAGFWIVGQLRPPAENRSPVFRFMIDPPPEAEFLRTPNHGGLALSPGGQRLVFLAVRKQQARLWVQPLDSLSALELPGTEDASHPFWSPDGRSIGFFAGGNLKRIDADGTGLQVLAPAAAGQRGSWGIRGVILFKPNGAAGIYQIPAVGGASTPVTSVDFKSGEVDHSVPQFLADGGRFLYRIERTRGSVGAPDSATLCVASLDGNVSGRIFNGHSWTEMARVGSDEFLLWVQGDVLVARRWDSHSLRLDGDPARIGSPVGTLSIDAYFTVSDGGPVVFGGPIDLQLMWYTRGGEPRGGIGEAGFVSAPRLSPDGRRVAIVRNNVLEAIDLRHGITSRLAGSTANRSLVWSPDGTRIAFNGAERNTIQVKQRMADGTGSESVIAISSADQYVADWAPDGRSILYIERSHESPATLRVVPVGESRSPRAAVPSGQVCIDAVISPDATWIAYVTNESGRFEVCVQRWNADLLRPRDERVQVSANGGNYPRWRRDSKELYCR